MELFERFELEDINARTRVLIEAATMAKKDANSA